MAHPYGWHSLLGLTSPTSPPYYFCDQQIISSNYHRGTAWIKRWQTVITEKIAWLIIQMHCLCAEMAHQWTNYANTVDIFKLVEKSVCGNFLLILRPGHTALYGLIMAKTHQKVVSREADNVVRVDVEFKMSYSRFIDMAGCGEKSERRWMRQKVLNCSKF